MSTFQDYSLIGKGLVHFDGRAIGNASVFSNTTEQEKIELKDFTSSGGGNYNSVSRLSAVGFALAMHDYSPENMAMALRGTTAAAAGGAQTDESITTGTALDLLIETDYLIDTDSAVVVTSDPAGTTYTVGTDYTVSGSGITVLSGGTMAVSTGYLVDYTALAGDVIQALTSSGSEFEIIVDGINEAQTGKPFKVKIHRAKPSAAEEMTWIGDEFAELAITGDALKDTTISSPSSQYIEITIADTA